MTQSTYPPLHPPHPDALAAPDPVRVAWLLRAAWGALRRVADCAARDEHLLAAEATASMRSHVLEMMLALNGIARPADTAQLNHYLSADQRAAIEKTLAAPFVSRSAWTGQAVALLVIYRWYAPQLVEKFSLDYPKSLEMETLAFVQQQLPRWPQHITTG